VTEADVARLQAADLGLSSGMRPSGAATGGGLSTSMWSLAALGQPVAVAAASALA